MWVALVLIVAAWLWVELRHPLRDRDSEAMRRHRDARSALRRIQNQTGEQNLWQRY